MKILVFSDIHGDLAALNRLLDIDADWYFAAGDLVSWARGFEKVGPVLQRRGDRMCVLPGNHESETDVGRLCEKYGLRPFHGQSMALDGVHVAGLGCSNPTPFNTPGEYSEAQLAERLAPFANLKPLVLVCHCPPLQTVLDEAGPNRHFGSRSVREFIERQQPKWFFCGHIHEAEGRQTQIGETRAVNVGKQGYLLDFANL
jgi:uncharacterized protein